VVTLPNNTSLHEFCILPAQCIYVFCMYFIMNSDVTLHSINLLVLLAEVESVYCAVRTGSLNETDYFPS